MDRKEVTVVTGPMRSGTSCVTGLLERCGFDLGRNIRVMRKQCEHNPKGHFEPDLLFTINERLLTEASNGVSGIFSVPDAFTLAALASQRDSYFRLFLNKFDGNLCKDPLFCITLPLWKAHWPEQRKAIFCLRHPWAVAQSLKKRYGISEAAGLVLWRTYTERFFSAGQQDSVFVFDFDAFINAPLVTFGRLLEWLEQPVSLTWLQKVSDEFFNLDDVHWASVDDDSQNLPEAVRGLYCRLRPRSDEVGEGAMLPTAHGPAGTRRHPVGKSDPTGAGRVETNNE